MIVTCAQVALDIDRPDDSWQRVLSALAAADAETDLLVLPELANTGYVFTNREEAALRAEPFDSARMLALADVSRRRGLVLVGGWCEAGPGGPYNSAFVIDHGDLIGTYRKCHLWDAETQVFTPGQTGPLVVDTTAGRLAIMICYDLEFPEFVRLAAQAGADLIAAPVNWPLVPRPVGQRPLETLKAQAYAGSYRIGIAIADRCGAERGVDWIGGSCVVGPDGYLRTPPPPAGPGREVMVKAQVDPVKERALGPHNHALEDRRPHLYTEPPATER